MKNENLKFNKNIKEYVKNYAKDVKLNINFVKALLYVIFAFILILFDQLTKQIALNTLIKIESNSLQIFNFFNFTLVLNSGVSFGLFSGFEYAKEVITVIVIFIILFIFLILLKEKNKTLATAYVAILSGAIGNTIDRITYGGVIDFLDFHIKNWHYPAFNLADSFIFIATFTIILNDFLKNKNR